VVTELVAILLLQAILGTGCFLGAVHRPRPARTAATVATALLGVGWLVLAGVLFAEAGSAENEGTFGASAIGLVGSIILLAGLGMAGWAS
jgi:hydroxyethylthiazole kinase-like sugar kinase family protein